ncbi:MAG TPA: ABC transporter ATP-binding protein [Blastocatellia bacterium]|nr:ABC transporter ATP-binding protein [Blastocatellia bacterium]
MMARSEAAVTAPIFTIRSVTKEYRMGSEVVRALDGVTLEIGRSEFVAILGTSGSGKSTLLNLLGGLDRPTSGDILFDGESLAPLSSREMSRYRLRKVGMIFQSFNLIPTMTARQNVSLALAFAGLERRVRQQKALDLLARVGLAARADHRPAELSGGEQQRVAIARALANNPQVLLADEPTGNLDSARAGEIMLLLDELRRRDGTTIILVTHDQDLAARFADRTIRLKDGRIEA